MRLFRRLVPSGLATLCVLALPFAQAHAEDCVQFAGMKHCAAGGAKLVVEGNELLAASRDASGKDGVTVDAGHVMGWSAGLRYEPSGEEKETTVKTHLSGGKVVSTSTVTDTAEGQEFAASFVDADGKPTTYSAMVFLEGRLVAFASGLPSGSVGARSIAGFGKPSCTILRFDLCMSMCGQGPIACAYCNIPCRHGAGNDQWVLGNGKYPYASHSFTSPFNGYSVGDSAMAAPEIVVGDELVLISDAPSAGAAQDIDQVLVTSTAKTVSLSNETVDHR
ncbi:hypothetical protein [Corallococcus sp. 4LFB]|uniref:hypothetical protein n=1 Tax=Corallococcus sp. 4LFB TaxID=3383249 RepID=UPI003975EC15